MNNVMGITPAYAGKTFGDNGLKLKNKDHPRLRGKDNKKAKTDYQNKGSPPLTRERHGVEYNIEPSGRITPAYAGKTGSK